jgi:hypothetical protein
MNLPEISANDVLGLATSMNTFGWGVYSDYLAPADLELLANFVQRAVEDTGGQYIAFSGPEPVAGTMFEELGRSPQLTKLLRALYQAGLQRPAPRQGLYQLLRCLKGQSGLKESLRFHYDSYVVTALLPIIIPATGAAGHLIMLPNTRKVRSNYLFNLLDKVILDNPLTQRFLRLGYLHFLPFKQVPMVPGNLYLFWGYRSIHANRPCDPDQIRATALFHFGDPHTGNSLRKITGRAKARATSL